MALLPLLRTVSMWLLLCAALAAHADPLPAAPLANGLALDDTAVYRRADGVPLYIPQYQVATDTVGITGGGQQQRYRMTLAADGADWVLTVHLQAQPSPQLALAPEQMAAARPLDDTPPRVSLSYDVPAARGTFRRERQFQTVLREAGGVQAALRLSSLSDQSELGAALGGNARFQLAVLRQADVTVQLPDPDPAGWTLLDDIQARQVQLLRNQAAFQDLQRRLGPGDSMLAPMQQRIADEQAALLEKRRVASGLQMRTRTDTRRLELAQQVRSDGFDIAQHPYVVQVPIARTTAATGLKQLTTGGHRYYQDAARPQHFYYLPDQFRLAADADGNVVLAVRPTLDMAVYRLEYMAAPETDPKRLSRDSVQLARQAGLTVDTLELEPLPADSYGFSLNLPHDSAWTAVERPGVVNSLVRPFTNAFQLPADDLRLLYEALMAQISPIPLFTGTVTVRIGTWARETVPFVGQVQGDPQQVWDRMFDRSIPSAFRRQVLASAGSDCFRRADAVLVTNRDGKTLELTAKQPEGHIAVGQDIDDFMQRRQPDGSFRYLLTWRAGAELTDGGTREGDGAQLLLQAGDLVAR